MAFCDRRHLRYPVSWKASTPESAEDLVVLDISAWGARLGCSPPSLAQFSSDERVCLKIYFPHLNLWVEREAQIRWLDSNPFSANAIGISFCEPLEGMLDPLSEWVQSNKHQTQGSSHNSFNPHDIPQPGKCVPIG